MNALIVTFDKCPNKDAGAIRVHMFANILNQIGYKVVVISMGDQDFQTSDNAGNVIYISFRSKGNKKLIKILDYLFFPLKLLIHLSKHQYSLCMHTQLEILNAIILKKYCRKRKIPIIFDAVEWFSAEQFKNGKHSLGYRINNYYNTKLIDKQYGVVSISSYLNRHFTSSGINSIQIPVIMDINSMPVHIHNDSNKVTLMYAGSPGRKDYLAKIIKALTLLNQNELDKLIFTIIGVTEEQLVTSCGVKSNDINKLRNCLNIKGRITRHLVLEELKKADFTILIRSDRQRYAKAGFPTKLVESFALGTPVIANITSDLGDYLIDNKNAIIVNTTSEEDICFSIKKIINLSNSKRRFMCTEAKKTATDFFDYHLFITSFEAFIQAIEEGAS